MHFKKWWRYLTSLSLHFSHDSSSPKRYNVLRRNIIIIMMVVTIVPLFFMLVMNYHQYRIGLKNEIVNPLYTLANKTKHSFELFLEERVSTVRFVASAYSYEDLADEKNLKRIFHILKQETGGFIDLGLIDSTGKLVAYAGPYDLIGKDYSKQRSFQEVKVRDVYISDVFMGYRKFPHIAIAVKHLTDTGLAWILRATIDTEKFDNLIASMGLAQESDAFLINREGIFQTNSKFYGKVLEKSPLPVPCGTHRTSISELVDPNGREILMACAHLDHPSYTLVVVKPSSVFLQPWYTLKSEILLIFGFSVGLILIVVFSVTFILVKKIKEADEKREKALRELEHTQKLSSIGRLAAGVAHEVNNPLAIINEKAGLMKDLVEYTESFPQKEKFIGLTDSIIQSVKRCSTITHRLLGFARRIEVQFEKLDMNELMKEVLGFLEREALYRKIKVDLQLADNLPEISSDKGQLQQVFLNIITNAFAVVEDGGYISIRTWEKDKESLCVSVHDNGHGMSQKVLKHIFEPFFTTKKGYGTGLGLSITYGIVKKLGGDIKVDSEEGKGTTFIISLPKKPDTEIEE